MGFSKSGRPLRFSSPGRLVLIVFLISCLIPMGLLWSAAQPSKPYKKEANLSTGWVVGHSVGAIKSFGWYFIPGIIKFDLNVAIFVGGSTYTSRDVPFSANLSFHLPIHRVTPFLTGGVGISFRGSSHKNLGGGMKIRTAKHTGLLLEYRYLTYRTSAGFGPNAVEFYRYHLNYIGAGISYFY